MKAFVLLAAVCSAGAAPQYLAWPYAAHAVVTGNSVPVSVGGYKAVAGSNGDLAGPVHEVPGLVPALAVQKQESSGDVSLSTGTGALVSAYAAPLVHHVYGKRSAEPQVLVNALPYTVGYHAYPYVVPAVKPLTLNTEVVATGQAVPVAIGGYKAEAGNNGELQGAVHEVPGLFAAPALNKQENSNGGARTVGTSALIKHTLSKREADPAILASSVSYVNPLPSLYTAPVYHPYALTYPYVWGK